MENTLASLQQYAEARRDGEWGLTQVTIYKSNIKDGKYQENVLERDHLFNCVFLHRAQTP